MACVFPSIDHPKHTVRWTSEVAAYTDVYFQYIPVDGDLTTAEKLEGWMVSHLADNTVVKKKVYLMYGGVEHMQIKSGAQVWRSCTYAGQERGLNTARL